MKKSEVENSSNGLKKRRPALTPEGRENQMIAYAIDLAEQQLVNGTASSQVITHFLKLGSTTTKAEKEILACQKTLMEAKTESLKSTQNVEKLMSDALSAMKNYSGQGDSDE